MTTEDAVVVADRLMGGLVIRIDRPPVNAINGQFRRELSEVLSGISEERFVVLRGSGDYFSAGAEVRELGQLPAGPTLRELLHTLEAVACPVVALVEGAALGGGLEMALACDYRLTTSRGRFGLPEIRLGLIPGAGGTARLPRLVGPEPALSLIASGRTIDADEALGLGLVDAVLPTCTVEAALADWLKVPRGKRTTSQIEPVLLDGPARARFEERVQELGRKAKNPRALAACVEAVRATLELPFDACEELEASTFSELVLSVEAAAQRYVFTSAAAVRRYNRKLPGSARRVHHLGIIGAGTMGAGIARAAAAAGLDVTVVEDDSSARARAEVRLREALLKAAHRAGVPGQASEETWRRINWSGRLDAVQDCDAVVEAVFEDVEVKRALFEQLEEVTGLGTMLATNTSYLEIERIASAVSDPRRVVGMHFFSPAHVMRLVEVVRTNVTSPDALLTAVHLAQSLGKTPVPVRSSHGFVGNRMLARRSAQAEALLLDGASPFQVDRVLTDFGFPMGPFAMADLAGLDVSWRNRQSRGVSAVVSDRLVEQGRLGQKTGRGFYRYGAGGAEPDPLLDRLIEELAAQVGARRRCVPDQEILDRLLLPMVDEGVQLWREGVVTRPSDIDVIWINGYGWPETRGGPMFWADQRGVAAVVHRLEELAALAGDEGLLPSDQLREFAAGEHTDQWFCC